MNGASFWAGLDGAGFQAMRVLLSVLWQSSILLAAVAVLSRALRRRRASVRHAIWVGALLVAPLLPLLASAAQRVGTPQAEILVMPAYTAPATRPALPLADALIPPSPPPPTPAGPVATMGPNKPSFTLLDYPWALALLVYGAGAMAFLSLVGLGRARVRNWVRRGIAVTDPRVTAAFQWARERVHLAGRYSLVESEKLQSPITVGLLKPTVLLPAGLVETLSDLELRAVAVHELAHLKRNDPLLLALASLVRAVLFFHPLVWLACRQIANLSEAACDDAVVDATGEPVSYARMLARLAEELPRRSFSTELSAGIILSKSAFLRRVEAILSDRRDQVRRLTRLALLATVVACILSLIAACVMPLGGRMRDPAAEADAAAEELWDVLTEAYVTSSRPITREQTERVRETLARGADPNSLDDKGRTPLHRASELGAVEVSRMLLEYGADVNARDGRGATPLHWTGHLWGPREASAGRVAVAELLLDHGADLWAFDDGGQAGYHGPGTPYDSANGGGGTKEFLAQQMAPTIERNAEQVRQVASAFLQALVREDATAMGRHTTDWRPDERKPWTEDALRITARFYKQRHESLSSGSAILDDVAVDPGLRFAVTTAEHLEGAERVITIFLVNNGRNWRVYRMQEASPLPNLADRYVLNDIALFWRWQKKLAQEAALHDADEEISFGPVIERVVPIVELGIGGVFLDLETGGFLEPPIFEGDRGSEWKELIAARKDGADAYARDWAAGHCLVTADALVLPTNGQRPWSFDDVAASDLLANRELSAPTPVDGAREGAKPGRTGVFTFMNYNSAGHYSAGIQVGHKIDTFAFRTRQGGIGILQIVGSTEDPPGVKIRYKMVQGDGTRRNSTPPNPRVGLGPDGTPESTPKATARTPEESRPRSR